ncbi:MAG TPA: IucA/IucC family C-terminal-domain containing protein [Acidimicrobiia bacterium]|jgi:ferric iron reductase protein FhuF
MTTVADVAAEVSRCVSYLRASTAITGDDWVRCDAIVDDRDVLTRVVEGTRQGFGTDDVAVAASLFVQAYAFRVAGVALAAYGLGLAVPDVAPAATAVRLDKPRPSAVAYLRPGVSDVDAVALVAALVDGHLRPFVDAVHGAFRVGERLLWGNVASSCATAFRALESSDAVADPGDVRARAAAFVDAAGDVFAGLGRFTTVTVDDREGWYWDRTSCCLWYQTSGGSLCDNCSLLERDELHRRRVAELTEAGSPA